MKDDTSQYPVMQLADIPVATMKLVDDRLTKFENKLEKRDKDRDIMIAKTSRRSVDNQTAIRVLFLFLFGVIVTISLTGC